MENGAEEGWQLVSRPRRPQPTQPSANPRITPYQPYKASPYYSTILTAPKETNPNPKPTHTNTLTNNTMTDFSTPPSSPPPTQAAFYISPIAQPYCASRPQPPSPNGAGAGFQCGKCWSDGHVENRCKGRCA